MLTLFAHVWSYPGYAKLRIGGATPDRGLPRGWTRDQEKMLLDPKLELGESELGTKFIEALRDGPETGEDGGEGR